jgi:DNA-directed RNA polymerase subunit RPC12/RpoP
MKKRNTAPCAECGQVQHNHLRHPETNEKVCRQCQSKALIKLMELGASNNRLRYLVEPQGSFKAQKTWLNQFFIGSDESWRERMDRMGAEVDFILNLNTANQ